ncbi:MAG: hypothetical protein ACHP7P_00930 [Terriglobales bacterium]
MIAMLHTTAYEKYEKLKKVFHRLMNDFNRDDLDDFVQTANSLPEWIRRDSTTTPEQRKAVARFTADESLDWQICHQVANHQKHFNSAPRVKARSSSADVPVVKAVKVGPAGAGFLLPSSMKVLGAGQEILVEYNQERESALGFVVRTFRHFHCIFEVLPLPTSERVTPGLMQIFG